MSTFPDYDVRSLRLITHPFTKCAGQVCSIHNPSNHHMRTWRVVWRDDAGKLERICKHGIGHPDPDDAAYLESIGRGYKNTHGCDGCCTPPKQGKNEKMTDANKIETRELFDTLQSLALRAEQCGKHALSLGVIELIAKHEPPPEPTISGLAVEWRSALLSNIREEIDALALRLVKNAKRELVTDSDMRAAARTVLGAECSRYFPPQRQ